MIRRVGLFLLSWSSLCFLHASDGGTTTAAFLTLPGEAKGAALGEAYSADATGSHALWYNPAGLSGQDLPSLSVMHTLFLEETSFSTLSGALPFGNGHAIGVGAGYFSAGGIPSLTAAGQSAPSYSPKDLNLRLGYSKRFSSLSIGFSLSHIRSTIQETATTNALNVGVRNDFGPLALAASVENIGPPLTFHTVSSPLPRQWRVGSRLRVLPSWVITSDGVQPLHDDPWVAVGTEISFPVIQENWVALRAGYNNRIVDDVTGMNGLSLGTGFRRGPVTFNYAWLPLGDLGQTHRFSFDYQLAAADVFSEKNDALSTRATLPKTSRLFLSTAQKGWAAMPLKPWNVTKKINRSSREQVMNLIARDALCPSYVSKAVITKLKGKVLVRKSHRPKWGRAVAGQYLFDGDSLKTETLSYAHLVMPNGIQVELGQKSLVHIKAEPQVLCEYSRVELENGSLKAKVDADSHLTVESPYGQAEWSGVRGAVDVSTQEIRIRVSSGSAIFTADNKRTVMENGKICHRAKDAIDFYCETDPDLNELDKPITPADKPTIAGRWDSKYTKKFEKVISGLETMPDLGLSEYMRDAQVRSSVLRDLENLKKKKDDLRLRSYEFRQDNEKFRDLLAMLRSQQAPETEEEKRSRRENLVQLKKGLKLAKESFGKIEKELKTALRDFREREEFLAAMPIVRMLNITAMETLIPFGKGSENVPVEAHGTLDRISEAINELKPYRVVVEGHTDVTGSRWANRRLSKKRADEVASYLKKKTGLKGHKFLTKGMGPDHPLTTEMTPEGMAKNRRVEIWLELRGL